MYDLLLQGGSQAHVERETLKMIDDHPLSNNSAQASLCVTARDTPRYSGLYYPCAYIQPLFFSPHHLKAPLVHYARINRVYARISSPFSCTNQWE